VTYQALFPGYEWSGLNQQHNQAGPESETFSPAKKNPESPWCALNLATHTVLDQMIVFPEESLTSRDPRMLADWQLPRLQRQLSTPTAAHRASTSLPFLTPKD
jgi:hypothetical protein